VTSINIPKGRIRNLNVNLRPIPGQKIKIIPKINHNTNPNLDLIIKINYIISRINHQISQI